MDSQSTNTSAEHEHGDVSQVQSPRAASSDAGLEGVQVESSQSSPSKTKLLSRRRTGSPSKTNTEVEDEGPIEEEGQANMNETKTKPEMPTERKTSKAYVSPDLPSSNSMSEL